MQNDKEQLNVDLGFLDEAKPRERETFAKSSYKVNWRNIAVIGGLIVVGIIWANSDNKSSAPRGTSAPVASVPVYQSPATNSNGGTVQHGQFRCSRYDSDQANTLSPVGEIELTAQQQALERRSNALDNLKTQLSLSSANQKSDQTAIDSYNAMVVQYNMHFVAFKSDVTAYQTRIKQFNAQVQAHNNYLLAHCRSGG